MSNLVIEDIPETLKNKFGEKTSFNNIIGLYWDGTDWCQYGEVIPTNEDINAYKKSISNFSKGQFISDEDFFTKLS